eukprot:gene30999-37465_t
MADLQNTDFLAFDSEHRLRAENLAFDIDVWYPLLAKFTFRSTFMPLKRVEAEAIRAFHDVSWRHCREALTSAEIQCLKQLEKDIANDLQTHFNNAPVMLRLCGRSPKDGDPLDTQGLQEQYEQHLRRLLQENGQPLAENEPIPFQTIPIEMKLQAINRVSTLKVRNAQEAMSLLLTSERVYADLIDWLKFGEPEQIVLREWNDHLTLDYEFRLFVYQGQVTAISQYDHYGYYPYLEHLKPSLQSGLLLFWQQVHAELGSATLSYVMDVGYLPQESRFLLIELSPFSPCTGAALFSWSRDKSVLTGQSPMEFRLKRPEDVHPQLAEIIQLNWEERWRKEHIPYSAWLTTSSSPFFGPIGSIGRLLFDNTRFHTNNHNKKHSLFVYGTLKRGFQWNAKYLAARLGARFICPAVTQLAFPLVIGDCGVPYLLGDMPAGTGKCVKGELWEISEEVLQGLDDYEGIAKGYYVRAEIDCIAIPEEGIDSKTGKKGQKVVKAQVYMVSKSFRDLREKDYVDEYTHENSRYQAIQHILVKQVAYYKEASTWGKTKELIATEAPTT